MKNYDLAIIGSGPGGYVAGLYAARNKLNVCVIEKDRVGGTCLNRGCVPTKSLLNSASIFSEIKNAGLFGLEAGSPSVNFDKVIIRKDEVVSRLRTGVETLLRTSGIDLARGRAVISDTNTIDIEGRGKVRAEHMIIASGSSAAGLHGIKIDESDILSSDGILNLKRLPGSIAIIGGGVIGCEFANLFNIFGVKVALIEWTDRLIPGQSREVSKKLELSFKKRGIEIFTSSKAEEIVKAGIFHIKISGARELESEKVLVSVGRRSNTEGLGLEGVGIKTDEGRILVDENLRTEIKNIYAIGDCVAGPLLAHKASYDGILACDNILGRPRRIDYSNIPNCIWTEPEIASVGLSVEEANARCPDARSVKFPYMASGRAVIEDRREGFVRIIGDSGGSILGVEIIGRGACELIAEAVLAKTIGINIKDWARAVHGHPTLSEIIQEAAYAFSGTAIHSI